MVAGGEPPREGRAASAARRAGRGTPRAGRASAAAGDVHHRQPRAAGRRPPGHGARTRLASHRRQDGRGRHDRRGGGLGPHAARVQPGPHAAVRRAHGRQHRLCHRRWYRWCGDDDGGRDAGCNDGGSRERGTGGCWRRDREDRFPPLAGWRRPDRRADDRRRPDAGQPQTRGWPARGRLPEHHGGRGPGSALRRHRLRDAGQFLRRDVRPDGRAHRRGRHGRVRAGRLPDRPRVRARAEADLQGGRRRRGEEGVQGRAPDAQLPGHRDSRRAAAARRDERPEHRGERHRAGQRHAAPAERAVGPGARHRAAHQGPRQTPGGQRHLRGPGRGAGGPREAAARGAQGGHRAVSGPHRIPAGQLREGLRSGVADQVAGPQLAALGARQHLDRRPHQHAAPAGYGGSPGGHPSAGGHARHPGQAGADRGAHRHRQRRLLARARRALRRRGGLQPRRRRRHGLRGLAGPRHRARRVRADPRPHRHRSTSGGWSRPRRSTTATW